MQWSIFRKLPEAVPDQEDLEYLRQETVAELAILLLVLSWLAALRAIPTDGPIKTLPTAFVLAVGGLGALLVRQTRFGLARGLVITSLVGAIALETLNYFDGPIRYYYPLMIVLSSLLLSRTGVFVVATVAGAVYTLIAMQHGTGWLDIEHMVHPMLLLLGTAFALWLASRQLITALSWMELGYTHARDALEELRDRRAVLARTLKALEEAYVRIEKMNDALATARSAAEEARRIKAEFAANISHELRTPLNLIIGFSETMANAPETYGDLLWPPSLRGDVDHIYRSSRHLASLIDDILDLSALDARRLGLQVMDAELGHVIDDAISVMESLYRAKGLFLHVDLAADLPPVRLDPTRIRQVLINLLNNASRFTREGGVTITVRLVEQDVHVAVSDTGIGIQPEDVPKVFEEFRQVDGSATRPYKGTGLGIPLSKRLVELHGGRMWLESTPGQGSTFAFTLPVAPDRAEAPPQAHVLDSRRPTPSPTLRKCVLVVEPGPLFLHALRRYMDRYDIVETHAPERLTDEIERYQPAALLIDSERSTVFYKLAANMALPNDLPILELPFHDSLDAARATGAQDYLIKPVTRSQLLRAVDRLVPDADWVLIVDDEPQFAELLSRMLQSAGRYRPIKTLGGTEALDAMRRLRPDVVLLDLAMPEVDGLAVLREMHNDPDLAGIPVIVVSAYNYVDEGTIAGGRSVRLSRGTPFTVPQMFGMVPALLDALPLRIPTRPESAPTYSATLGG